MKVGDLVQKTGGFGSECGWVGIVIDINPACFDAWGDKVMTLTVMTESGVDEWIQVFCEVISEHA